MSLDVPIALFALALIGFLIFLGCLLYAIITGNADERLDPYVYGSAVVVLIGVLGGIASTLIVFAY